MHLVKYPEKGRISKEGVVIKWALGEGQFIKNEDLILQIESAGELIEIKSNIDGTLLKALAPVGSFVRSGEPLAIIGQKDEDISHVINKLDEHPAEASQKIKSVQSQPKVKKSNDLQSVESHSIEEEVMTTPQSAGNPDNVIPILMPQAGQSMEEGTILSWKVKEGDSIEVGQVIMEIETDKATMEVEATDAGQIARIVASEGDIVEVKKPVAFIADNDADVKAHLSGVSVTTSTPAAPKAAASAAAAPAPAPSASSTPAPSTPAPSAPASSAPVQPAVSAPEGAVVPVLMPQAGQSMEEGTILAWNVSEGDQIEVGQIIMEIETDKATMEVEAVDAGRITKIVAAEGSIVEVKQPVAYLAATDVDIDAYVAGESTAAPVPSQPAAQTAAQKKDIDPGSASSGSGPDGRNLSTDVEQADVIPTEVQIHPLTKMRRAIANNLLYSKQNIPHFYAKKTIDAALLFTTYRKTKEQFKCSVNDFVTKACAKAIRQYPAFRSQYKDTEVHENPAVNIGIAVGTDEGLTVPVVLDADKQNLEQLAAQTRQVVESARNGKLENFGHGIFTITNMGMFNCEEFSAIINPPESAILAVGAIREGVIVVNGDMRPTRLMTIVLSVDHRVVDGVLAAQFLNTVQELLEDPEQLVI